MSTPIALKRLTLVLLSLLLAGCAIVDYEQRRWIFMPGKRSAALSAEAARGLQDVWIDYVSAHPEHEGEPVRLHGLWLPQADAAAPVLLFLHGVRWDVPASVPRMRQWHALGFSVLAIDYRGFGRSSDALPSETMAVEDARAAWDWLVRTQPRSRRYIAGHSLGAVLAVQVAQEVADEDGVIAEGAFTSVVDVLNSTRWGWLPIQWMITQHFDAGSRIAEVGSPVLVIHGADDTMVSPQLGRALYDRALEPKRFLLVEGAVHENTDVVGHQRYREALREFFGLGRSP